jgi:hypothetical protein
MPDSAVKNSEGVGLVGRLWRKWPANREQRIGIVGELTFSYKNQNMSTSGTNQVTQLCPDLKTWV